MAAKSVAESTPYSTKSGPEVDNAYNQALYTTCLYFDGLKEAQDAYDLLRPRLDLRMLDMVAIAFRIGDETYTDFTDGKPLYPTQVNYAPRVTASE